MTEIFVVVIGTLPGNPKILSHVSVFASWAPMTAFNSFNAIFCRHDTTLTAGTCSHFSAPKLIRVTVIETPLSFSAASTNNFGSILPAP